MISITKNHRDLTLSFLTLTSVFGLLLSLLFVVYPPVLDDDWVSRSLAAGFAFCAVCIFGIFAAFLPGSCSRKPSFGQDSGDEEPRSLVQEKTLEAHHPLCGNYSTHILHVGGRSLCATCTGLSVGAFGAVVGAIVYFFAGFRIGMPNVLALIGALAVVAGLLHSAMPKSSNGYARFFFSVVFVVGCFLLLVGLDATVESITIDLFFVALCVLLIMTKIAFSQRDHSEICLKCSSESCRPDRIKEESAKGLFWTGLFCI